MDWLFAFKAALDSHEVRKLQESTFFALPVSVRSQGILARHDRGHPS